MRKTFRSNVPWRDPVSLWDAELAAASSAVDAVFVHTCRFVSAARSRLDAVEPAQRAMVIGLGHVSQSNMRS